MRFYICLLFILIASALYAQEEVEKKRAWVVGGSLTAIVQKNSYPSSFNIPTPPTVGGIYSGFNSEFTSSYLSVLPYIGRKLGDNWLMGLELGYVRRGISREVISVIIVPPPPLPSQTEYARLKEVSNAFRIGIFERFTFNPSQKFQFFSQFNLVYTTSVYYQEQVNIPDLDGSASYIDIGIDLGANYHFTEKWRAMVSIGTLSYYNGSWESSGGLGNHFSTFSFDFDPARIRIGLEYLF